MQRGRSTGRRRDLAYVDTNVFVSLLVGPAHPSHESALGMFRRVAEGSLGLIVTPIVVAELAYVSRSPMGWTHRQVAERLEDLLEADGLVVVEREVVIRALRIYGERPKLDFADAYLAAAALETGPGVVASFDRDLDGIEGVKRLSA